MQTTDTAALESLRAFALDHGEIAFSHLVTAALAGEHWAVERMAAPLRVWAVAQTLPVVPTAMLDVIRSTDTTRPDGAIARSSGAPI